MNTPSLSRMRATTDWTGMVTSGSDVVSDIKNNSVSSTKVSSTVDTVLHISSIGVLPLNSMFTDTPP